jgi:protein-S-isoprenylcysteine O-methyltransferase Ste14
MAETSPSSATTRKAYFRLVLAWLLLPLFFLLTGGSFGWWEAWVYCALILVPMTVFAVRWVRRDPEAVERRCMMKEKERAQRPVVLWGGIVTLALFILPGLDRRFGWSHPGLAAVIAGQALVLASYLGIVKVFAVNRWAGRTIETAPGQQVVSTGPYAIVRHPMYAVGLVFYAATAVALGSWWAVIPAVLFVPVFVVRLRNEEDVLVRDLPGYDEYRTKVRYRLLPHVW